MEPKGPSAGIAIGSTKKIIHNSSKKDKENSLTSKSRSISNNQKIKQSKISDQMKVSMKLSTSKVKTCEPVKLRKRETIKKNIVTPSTSLKQKSRLYSNSEKKKHIPKK